MTTPPPATTPPTATSPLDGLGDLLGQLFDIHGAGPKLGIKVQSNLRSIAKSGRLRLAVRADEPAAVRLSSLVRVGPSMDRVATSRKLVKVPSTVLGASGSGTQNVSIQITRAARRALGGARTAKISVLAEATDAFGNQSSQRMKLRIKR